MGLGSKDDITRKEVKAVLPKHDWKAKVRGSVQAYQIIESIKQTRPKFKDGSYLIDTYTELKLKQLEAYAKYCVIMEANPAEVLLTLKEYGKAHP